METIEEILIDFEKTGQTGGFTFECQWKDCKEFQDIRKFCIGKIRGKRNISEYTINSITRYKVKVLVEFRNNFYDFMYIYHRADPSGIAVGDIVINKYYPPGCEPERDLSEYLYEDPRFFEWY